jgi:hypothetical protein
LVSYFALFSQNLLHRFSIRDLIYELIEVADFFHESIFHVLDLISTDGARDEGTIRVELRITKKGLEIDFFIEYLLQSRCIIASEPFDDLVEFLLGPSLALHFRDVEGIDGSK